MNARILKHFHIPARCYAAVLVRGEQDMLGILSMYYLEGTPERRASLVSLILLNLQTQVTEAVITYNGMGPDRLNSLTTDALLTYDPIYRRWIIAQLQDEWYVGVRTLTKQSGGTYLLSPLCLLDRGEGERGMNPLLGLECQGDIYRVLYHRDVPGHVSAGEVRKIDLYVRHPEWERLQEQAWTMSSECDSAPMRYSWQMWHDAISVPPLEEGYVEPEGVVFDPGTSHIQQTSAVKIQGQKAIAESENAMMYSTADFHVLALFCPENWVRPTPFPQPKTQPPQHGEWRLWLTSWDNSWTDHQWTYALEIGVPSDSSLPPWEYPSWPDADVALLSGPRIQQHATLVAVLHVQPLEGGVALSQGVCLDKTGQLIQHCQDGFGRYPHLACCGQMVIGVDRQEGGWRLWNWQALQSAHLQMTLPLDAACQRSSVHAEPERSWFWLVEEFPSGVRISQYDAISLTKVADEVWLSETKLLETQTEFRPLNGYHDKGIIHYNGTLLLLIEDNKGELVLYQIQ